VLAALLVLLALLEAARNAGWQRRGVRSVLEANGRAREEHCCGGGGGGGCGGSGGGVAAAAPSDEATASAEVRVEGKKKA